MREAAALLAFVIAVSMPRTGFANGRFPAAQQLIEEPTDPAHLVLRATYGLAVSNDHGGSWRWICESAVGYASGDDPALAILDDGTLIAGFNGGLSATRDRGCVWTPAPELAGSWVLDVTRRTADPLFAAAITVLNKGMNQVTTRLWRTPDDAQTWTPTDTGPESSFVPLAFDVAPSDANVVYISGQSIIATEAGFERQPALLRTFDGGTSFERVDLVGIESSAAPYLTGIDPASSSRVILRLKRSDGDVLVVSDDGGDNWHQVFSAIGDLTSFALSPDGTHLLVGGPCDGVYEAALSDFVFEKLTDLSNACLTWTQSGVYACGYMSLFSGGCGQNSGFELGFSRDGGHNFEPLLVRGAISGALECGADAAAMQFCAENWPGMCPLIGPCDGGAPSESIGLHPVRESAVVVEPSGGCGCRARRSSSDGRRGTLLLAVAALLLLPLRRARKRFDDGAAT